MTGGRGDPYKTTQAGADALASQVPDDMKTVVTAISGDMNQATLVLLIEKDRALTFTEICETFGFEYGDEERDELRTALGEMQDGGLVVRHDGSHEREQTRYEVTQKAFDVLDGLATALNPKKKPESP